MSDVDCVIISTDISLSLFVFLLKERTNSRTSFATENGETNCKHSAYIKYGPTHPNHQQSLFSICNIQFDRPTLCDL